LTPWFGATAHAVFFQAKTLAYFHTHVCAPDLKACLQSIGGIPVGHSDKPGVLRVGLVMPATRTWRLFLHAKAGGLVLPIPLPRKVTPCPPAAAASAPPPRCSSRWPPPPRRSATRSSARRSSRRSSTRCSRSPSRPRRRARRPPRSCSPCPTAS